MTPAARRIGALAGIAAVLVFLVMYGVAMYLDTEYVFMENYLSDLGVKEGAWAFNSGAITAGILFMAMDVLAVAPALGGGGPARGSVGLLMVAAAFLVSVGIFTENAGDLHGVVSYGFFLTMLAALGALTYVLRGNGLLGRPAFVVTLASFIFGMLLIPFGGTPPVETLAVIAIMVWGLFMAVTLLRAVPEERPS